MNPVVSINNGHIDNITKEKEILFVTVTYTDRTTSPRMLQTVKLIVNDSTVVLDAKGKPFPPNRLRKGMTIDATISSAMTRSIPMQAAAFRIQVVSNATRDNITVGRVLNIDFNNNSFTVIRDGNLSPIIVFHVTDNTRFFDRLNRPSALRRLLPGMKVRVRHATFMTASIPPQTTAYEVQTL